MRKGKYHHYKLALLEHLVENDFLIKFGDRYENSFDLANKLDIPISSWYDITTNLDQAGLILLKYKNANVRGVLVHMVYEIQLTRKGLEFLIRFNRA